MVLEARRIRLTHKATRQSSEARYAGTRGSQKRKGVRRNNHRK
jgi:hypothetical protein